MILTATQIHPVQERLGSPARSDSHPCTVSQSDYVYSLIDAIIAARNQILTAEYLLVMKKVIEQNHRSSMSRDCRISLTVRQQQTLILLLCGYSEKEIAVKFGVRPSTVHAHIRAIFESLGIHSRSELMALFLRPLVQLLVRQDLEDTPQTVVS